MNIVQAIALVVLIGLATLGAIHLDRQLSACADNTGYLEALSR